MRFGLVFGSFGVDDGEVVYWFAIAVEFLEEDVDAVFGMFGFPGDDEISVVIDSGCREAVINEVADLGSKGGGGRTGFTSFEGVAVEINFFEVDLRAVADFFFPHNNAVTVAGSTDAGVYLRSGR